MYFPSQVHGIANPLTNMLH